MNAKIMGVENMDPFYGAPVVLIVLADKSRPTCVYDGSLVMGNLMLEAEEQGIECYISLEERMACGIGACLACVCRSKEKDAHSNVNNKRICKDGPVFLATEVEI
jgi:NAD(P)H-flavin reductase